MVVNTEHSRDLDLLLVHLINSSADHDPKYAMLWEWVSGTIVFTKVEWYLGLLLHL